MKFIFPQNYNFKNKLLGIIDYSTAFFNIFWYVIIFILLHFFIKNWNIKIFIWKEMGINRSNTFIWNTAIYSYKCIWYGGSYYNRCSGRISYSSISCKGCKQESKGSGRDGGKSACRYSVSCLRSCRYAGTCSVGERYI